MNPLETRLAQARALAQKKQYQQAVDIYKAVLGDDSENFSAFIGLGKAYLELKMWEESLYFFLRAEVIKPVPEVYLNIGVLFYKKQNYKKSLEYYEKAEVMGRPLFEIYWNKGLVYEKMKKTDEAVLSYIKAYDLKSSPELCFKIAPMALQAKLYRESVRFYKLLLKNEEHPLYYAEMGLAYMQLGMYEESKNCYQRAKELSGITVEYKEPTFDDFVAQYPDIESSIETINNKITTGKAQYEDHFHMGNMLFIRGDYEKSAEAYQRARDNYVSNLLMAKL
jgi:tetratricopeptide (TPR) repeat protein